MIPRYDRLPHVFNGRNKARHRLYHVNCQSLCKKPKALTHKGRKDNPAILKGLRKRQITYGGQSELLVEGYSDSDWARDKESRKSILGFIFMLNGGPISWWSKDNQP